MSSDRYKKITLIVPDTITTTNLGFDWTFSGNVFVKDIASISDRSWALLGITPNFDYSGFELLSIFYDSDGVYQSAAYIGQIPFEWQRGKFKLYEDTENSTLNLVVDPESTQHALIYKFPFFDKTVTFDTWNLPVSEFNDNVQEWVHPNQNAPIEISHFELIYSGNGITSKIDFKYSDESDVEVIQTEFNQTLNLIYPELGTYEENGIIYEDLLTFYMPWGGVNDQVINLYYDNVGKIIPGNIDLSLYFLDGLSTDGSPIPDITLFDTSNVWSTRAMFYRASDFNQDISGWDVSRVSDMAYMFADAASFNQDISLWDTASVASLQGTFKNATNFDYSLGNWDISGVSILTNMLDNSGLSTQNYDETLIGWYQLAQTEGVKQDLVLGAQGLTFSSRSLDSRNGLISDFGWEILGDALVNSAPEGYVEILGVPEQYATLTAITDNLNDPDGISLLSYQWAADDEDINGANNNTYVLTEQELDKKITVKVSYEDGLGSTEFVKSTSTEAVQKVNKWPPGTDLSGYFVGGKDIFGHEIPDVTRWDTSSVTDTSALFMRAEEFDQDISAWEVTNVSNARGMFSVAIAFDQDLNTWNTANITDMAFMFATAKSFNGLISDWDTSSVTDMSYMFNNAEVFNQNLNKWDTAAVSNMSHMFKGAKSFNQNIENWDTSSVTDMSYMFNNAGAFNQDLNSWDISNTNNIEWMFAGATSFNRDLSSWDTSSITDMSQLFYGTLAFNGALNNWNTSSVTDMTEMFKGAEAFNQDLSFFDTASVESMAGMFNGASLFNNDLADWDISNVKSMSKMLDNSGLSTQNYDETLISWYEQAIQGNVQNNVELGAMGLTYSSISALARDYLISEFNWEIIGDEFSNTAPIGQVQIVIESGKAMVLSAIEDQDGLGDFSYKWFKNGIELENETYAELILTSDFLGSTVSVQISYRDGYGSLEKVSSDTSQVLTQDDVQINENLFLEYNGTGTETLTAGPGIDILKVSNHLGWSEFRSNDDLIMYASNGVDTLTVSGAYSEPTKLEYIQYVDQEGLPISEKYNVLSINDTVNAAPNFFAGTENNDTVTLSPSTVSAATGYLGDDEIIGSIGRDFLGGNEGDDVLVGNEGDDVLIGHEGDDQLFGLADNDILVDSAGLNILEGGSGEDTIFLASDNTFSVRYAAKNVSSSFQVGTEEMLNLSGLTHFESVINGGQGFDTVNLTENSDALFLHDTFSGFHSLIDLDADAFGQSGTARIEGIEKINASAGNDIIDLTSPDYSLFGANIEIHGGEGNDTIWGSDANETLNGGEGDDVLFGGSGINILNGGSGADEFQFTSTSTHDTINDFDIYDGDRLKFFNSDGVAFDSSSVAINGTKLIISYSDIESLTITLENTDLSLPDLSEAIFIV